MNEQVHYKSRCERIEGLDKKIYRCLLKDNNYVWLISVRIMIRRCLRQ